MKLKDRIKIDLKKPLWKFVVLFFLFTGLYLIFIANNHFLKNDACSSCSGCK
ncbi:MAG: hypothetical protein L6420_00225 [Elusimicrobia bacterium]|nr:hypothetical protein [Elusimicrobiota bacterium]